MHISSNNTNLVQYKLSNKTNIKKSDKTESLYLFLKAFCKQEIQEKNTILTRKHNPVLKRVIEMKQLDVSFVEEYNFKLFGSKLSSEWLPRKLKILISADGFLISMPTP